MDTWGKDAPLANKFLKLFKCASNAHEYVSNNIKRVGDHIVYSPTFQRNFTEVDEGQFLDMFSLVNGVNIPVGSTGRRVWSGTTDGNFQLHLFLTILGRLS